MATIEIKVTFDSKKESLEQALANLLTEKPENKETYQQLSLFDKTEEPTAPTAPETPAADPAPAQTPDPQQTAADTPADPAPQEEPKKVSQSDVRALAVALSKNNKPALKAIFKELGVTSFSGVKEEDYPVFYEKLGAANG